MQDKYDFPLNPGFEQVKVLDHQNDDNRCTSE